jgi:hypothetical protein
VNRQPPYGGFGEPPPRNTGYRRRPDADEPTRINRLPPPEPRPTPGSQEIPWYLQRPDRRAPIRPPAATDAARTSRNTTDVKKYLPWALIAAGALMLLIGAGSVIVNGARLGFGGGGTVLDVTQVQAGVLRTLSDPASGYGANTVTDVSCNGGRNPSARAGTTFTCDATVNGAPRHVAVVVSDDKGTYEIDSPR